MSPNRTSLENLFEIRRSVMFLELFRMFLAELLCFPFCVKMEFWIVTLEIDYVLLIQFFFLYAM